MSASQALAAVGDLFIAKGMLDFALHPESSSICDGLLSAIGVVHRHSKVSSISVLSSMAFFMFFTCLHSSFYEAIWSIYIPHFVGELLIHSTTSVPLLKFWNV